MAKEIDLDTWPRRQTFDYFKAFDHPWFNLCTKIEVAPLNRYVKQSGQSFFLTSLYLVLRAINHHEALRLRLTAQGECVLDCETIHATSVVLDDEDRMGLCPFRYHADAKVFLTEARSQLTRIKRDKSDFRPSPASLDVIHTSVLPWVSFTSISHARRHNRFDSIPKLTFGRLDRVGSECWWPLSIEVHHALVDGFHLGHFCQFLQHLVHNPSTYLSNTPPQTEPQDIR